MSNEREKLEAARDAAERRYAMANSLAPYSPSSASRALVDAAAEADRRFKYANDVYADALTERRKAERVRNAAYNELFSADYDAQD